MPSTIEKVAFLPALDFRIIDAMGQPGSRVSKTSIPAAVIAPAGVTFVGGGNTIPFLVWPSGGTTQVRLDFDLSGENFLNEGSSPGDHQLEVSALTLEEWGSTVLGGNMPTFDVNWFQIDNPGVNLISSPIDFNGGGFTAYTFDTSGDECPNFTVLIAPTSIPGNNGLIAIQLRYLLWS